MRVVLVLVMTMAACGGGQQPAPSPVVADASKPIDIHQFKHANDDDVHPVMAPPHPFWSDMTQQVHAAWSIPMQIEPNLQVTMCLHIRPDGTIAALKQEAPSGVAEYDQAAQRAFEQLQRERNAHPIAVPDDQLVQIRSYVCFRMRNE